MVHEGSRVRDEVDPGGQVDPPLVVEAEAVLADVSGQHLERARQLREAPGERGIGGERGLEAAPGVGVVGAAHDAHQRAARRGQALEPVDGQEPAEVAVRAGEQDRAGSRPGGRGPGDRRRDAAEHPVEPEVAHAEGGCAGAVHAGHGRPVVGGGALHVGGDGGEVVGRVGEDADGHLGAEDVLEDPGERQRGQRVAAEVGEPGSGGGRGGHLGPEEQEGGAHHRVDRRLVVGAFAERGDEGAALLLLQRVVEGGEALAVPLREAQAQGLPASESMPPSTVNGSGSTITPRGTS